MARLTRLPWARMSPGLEILPPTLMVALGYPWLGAATLGAVLVSSALRSWMWVRSEQERHRALLSYAQDSTSMGGDPTAVIATLQRRMDEDVPPELPPRGEKSRDSAATELLARAKSRVSIQERARSLRLGTADHHSSSIPIEPDNEDSSWDNADIAQYKQFSLQGLTPASVYVTGDGVEVERVFSALGQALDANGFEIAAQERVAHE